MRDTERAIRSFRWVAVVFALAQIGFLYEPPAGVGMPFPRLPVAVLFAATLVGLNLASRWLGRQTDERPLRAGGIVLLAADTALAVGIVVIFAFDTESRLWPLFALPVLEGAMREHIRGAIVVAAATAASDGYVGAAVSGWGAAELVSAVAFRLGILVTVAIGAGALAARFEQTRAAAESYANRLRHLHAVSTTLPSTRLAGDVLNRVLEATREVTGVTEVEIHTRDDEGWKLRARLGDDGATLLDSLLTGGGVRRLDAIHGVEVIASDRDGLDELVLVPIGVDEQPHGLLVLPSSTERGELTGTDREVLELLAAHVSVAIDNARTAEAEERTIQELRALDEVKAEFVDILTHELRGPMTTVHGYAEVLQRRWRDLDEERRQEFLDAIARGSERLTKLVSDIEDVTEADGRALPVSTTPVRLEPIVELVAAEEIGLSDAHRLELAFEDDLPPVLADPDRVVQVLGNLVSNAVKYSPDGGRVRLAVRRAGDAVEVTVTDDGFGIPPHLRKHLFEKFSRLPTPVRVPGTGLGLYLSRKLVEAMGGEVGVESEEGRGSTFRFTLPVAEREPVRTPGS
ncbi:MAG: sensor histidine kinase [Nitriliruptorales bacterium]